MIKHIRYTFYLNSLLFIIAILTFFTNNLNLTNISSIYYVNSIFWFLSSVCLFVDMILVFYILENFNLSRNGIVILLLIGQLIVIKGAMVSFWGLSGYFNFLLRGDQATYIGLAKDILFLGSFGNDFYPFTGILISTMSLITRLTPEEISVFVPAFFICICAVGIALLAKTIKNKIKVLLTSILFSVPFIYNWFSVTIYPHFTSTLMLPLMLYVVLNYKKYKLIFVFLSISVIMWHPITAYSLFLFFLVISILNYKNSELIKQFIIYSFILFIWTFSYQALTGTLSFYLESVMGEYQITTFDVALSYASKLGIEASLRTIAYMVLDDLIFYILVFLSLIFLLKNRFYFNSYRLKNLKFCYIWFLINGLLIIFLFFNIRGHVPDRLINLNWGLIVAPAIIGVFYNLIKNRMTKYVLIVLLVISTSFSVITLYPSSIINKPNEAALVGEVKGADWIIVNRDENIRVSYILTPLLRYSDLLYGTKYPGRGDLHIGYVHGGDSYTIPNHFDLSSEDRKFLGLRYFILTEYEIHAYNEIWKTVDRFNQNDFNKFEINIYSNLLYRNGNFIIYLVDFEKFI